MKSHKFTDKELQKCFECCIEAEILEDCEEMKCPALTIHGCRFYLRTDDDYEGVIYIEMLKDALGLINRQKTEIANGIFAEIEAEIKEALKSNYKVLSQLEFSNELWNRVQGKIDALRGIDGFIDELEEKYIPTEGD